MENASKALIIAGAILISILLISIGIVVINSISDPLNQSKNQAEQQAIEMFNSKFTGYAGNQQYNSVKSLMTAIQSSNGQNPEHPIVMKSSLGDTPGVIQSMVNSKTTYTVVLEDLDANGYIDEVSVEPATAGAPRVAP